MKMKIKQTLTIGCLILATQISNAGPIISGGGNMTVQQASGTADVMNMRDSALVTIEGDGAELLFNSLKVEGVTPPFSDQIIKTIKGSVQCVQSTDGYMCMIHVSHK